MGVIVSGSSILKIFANDKLRVKFIDLIEMADVILACRVSPKQKAQIVNMARE